MYSLLACLREEMTAKQARYDIARFYPPSQADWKQ